MESLYIASDSSTPEISFDTEDNTLHISGRSYPSDPGSFYEPVFEWLENYLSTIDNESVLYLNFRLDYYNTSTSKQFAKLFKILEDSNIRDSVRINWFYRESDIDMLEAGERFSQITELRFEILKNQG